MDRRTVAMGLAALAVTAAGLAWGWSRWSRPVARGPNVLIVLWDTVRADRLSLYGHPVETTPYLKKMGEESWVFEEAVSPGTWTVPSHGSLFTGLPATSHGANGEWKWLDEQHLTLAEEFGAAGYGTYLFTSNPMVSEATNMSQGFGTVERSWDPWGDQSLEAAKAKLIAGDRSSEISPDYEPDGRKGFDWARQVFKDSGSVIAQAFPQWLDTQGDRPFFAYLNYMEAHSPRIPSMASRKKLLNEKLIGLGLETDMTQAGTWDYTFSVRGLDEDQLDAVRGVYDASLLDLDIATQALLEELDRRGILDETIVVVTSDHGEHLGEHFQWEHRYGVYEPLVHVPLLVRYPARLKPQRFEEPVSNVRIGDTLRDLAGLVPGAKGSLVHEARGPAFSEVTALEPLTTTRVRKAFPGVDLGPLIRTFQMVRDGDHKLIVASDGEVELYDVAHDEGELARLEVKMPDEVARLQKLLAAEHAGRVAYNPAGRTASDKPLRYDKDSEMLEQLRLLGYVE